MSGISIYNPYTTVNSVVSDFISQTTGPIKLSEGQIKDQLKLPAEHPSRLPAFQARKIIYPGKGFDVWWVLPQLIKQVDDLDLPAHASKLRCSFCL